VLAHPILIPGLRALLQRAGRADKNSPLAAGKLNGVLVLDPACLVVLAEQSSQP